MDQKKIGKYIASKRKDLGLTQVQLAEKLNMSNKSVSKWERGVCLPDVSLYEKLCQVLGISLNEFLAGEDLLEVEIVLKSEETILSIAMDHKQSRRRANCVTVLLMIFVIFISGALLDYMHQIHPEKKVAFYGNCLLPLSEKSPEMQAANLFGENDAWMYRYYVKSPYTQYKGMQLRYYWYKDGELTEEGILVSCLFSGEHDGEGMIAVIDDHENGDLDFKVTLEGKNPQCTFDDTVCEEFKLPLEGQDLQDWQKSYPRSVELPKGMIRLNHMTDKAGLFMMTYDESGRNESLESVRTDGFWPRGVDYCPDIAENDYTVFITVEFYWHL